MGIHTSRSPENDGGKLFKVLNYYNFDVEKVGTNLKIICPFHEDVNPSMLVDLEVGRWYCFGCNIAGGALEFVKKVEGLNDFKATFKLNKIINSKELSNLNFKPSKAKKKASKSNLNDIAQDYYYGLLKTNWEYLDPINHKEFYYGMNQSLNYMLSRGFTIKSLNKVGMRYSFSKSYPLIFPMLDNGKFKGYVCRTTLKEVEAKRKYLYNEGFSRRETLVGNYGKQNYVVLVEGYMDRLKLIQLGLNHVVAILGWKITDEQIEKLKKEGVEYIISALDNDECGKKGTEYLKKFFKVTRFKYLKGVKDPGEFNESNFKKMFAKTKKSFNELRKGEN